MVKETSSPDSSLTAALHTVPCPLAVANALGSPLVTTSTISSSKGILGFKSFIIIYITIKARHKNIKKGHYL
jgi:hypothetical protein